MTALLDSKDIKTALRQELLKLCRTEEDSAATEGAAVPYWAPYPPSVGAHRRAAAVLRAYADSLLVVA